MTIIMYKWRDKPCLACEAVLNYFEANGIVPEIKFFEDLKGSRLNRIIKGAPTLFIEGQKNPFWSGDFGKSTQGLQKFKNALNKALRG